MAGRLREVGRENKRLRMAAALARTIFPHFCVGCDREGSVLCERCLSAMSARMRGVFHCPTCDEPTPYGVRCDKKRCADGLISGIIAGASYADVGLRTLLHRYKYEGVREAGEAIDRVFTAFLRAHEMLVTALVADAIIVPVPLHWHKETMRGFNQSHLFASALARVADGVVDAHCLRRRFRLRPQAKLRGASRRANAAASIECAGALRRGARIILVDDVYTTGATAAACAAALEAAGADEVFVVSFLRGAAS